MSSKQDKDSHILYRATHKTDVKVHRVGYKKEFAIDPCYFNKLSRAVQPLVFETNNPDFPYSVSGTVFLVGYEGKSFIITTRHSLYPENISSVFIFPSDTSYKCLPLKDVFFVPVDEEPEDFMDLAVIEIDTEKIKDLELAQATLIDVDLASGDWESSTEKVEFYILGFPSDHAFIDIENNTLHTERFTLCARYIGTSTLQYLHEIEITNCHTLSTFSGFSGSPVFGLIQDPNESLRITLCGMVIRGTTSSGRIHFLDRSVLIDALNAKCNFKQSPQ